MRKIIFGVIMILCMAPGAKAQTKLVRVADSLVAEVYLCTKKTMEDVAFLHKKYPKGYKIVGTIYGRPNLTQNDGWVRFEGILSPGENPQEVFILLPSAVSSTP